MLQCVQTSKPSMKSARVIIWRHFHWNENVSEKCKGASKSHPHMGSLVEGAHLLCPFHRILLPLHAPFPVPAVFLQTLPIRAMNMSSIFAEKVSKWKTWVIKQNTSIYLVHHIVITIRNKAFQQSDSRYIPGREYIPIWLKSHAFSTDIRSFAICTISFDFATCTRMSENIGGLLMVDLIKIRESSPHHRHSFFQCILVNSLEFAVLPHAGSCMKRFVGI